MATTSELRCWDITQLIECRCLGSDFIREKQNETRRCSISTEWDHGVETGGARVRVCDEVAFRSLALKKLLLLCCCASERSLGDTQVQRLRVTLFTKPQVTFLIVQVLPFVHWFCASVNVIPKYKRILTCFLNTFFFFGNNKNVYH